MITDPSDLENYESISLTVTLASSLGRQSEDLSKPVWNKMVSMCED